HKATATRSPSLSRNTKQTTLKHIYTHTHTHTHTTLKHIHTKTKHSHKSQHTITPHTPPTHPQHPETTTHTHITQKHIYTHTHTHTHTQLWMMMDKSCIHFPILIVEPHMALINEMDVQGRAYGHLLIWVLIRQFCFFFFFLNL